MREEPPGVERPARAIRNCVSHLGVQPDRGLGFAIASVLIVSVLKRSREIGILKAMGARERRSSEVFTLEGLGVALLRATVGAALGIALILAARRDPPSWRAPRPGAGAAPPWRRPVADRPRHDGRRHRDLDSRQRLSGQARGPPRSGGSDPGWLADHRGEGDPQSLWRRRTDRVLHGIDLTIRAGEFVAVVGQSGSGKSTLLNILGALDRPTGDRGPGGVPFQELESDDLANLRNCKIGFIFQYPLPAR